MKDAEILKRMKEAIEAEKQIPPGERFQSMVKSGLIDENGQLIRDDEPELIKPTKEYLEILDYNKCAKYIEQKYGVHLRDYAGKYFGPNPDQSKPYLDFWHSVLDRCEVSSGSFFYLYFDEWGELNIEDWEQEILDMFEKEFAEYIENRAIKFWVR